MAAGILLLVAGSGTLLFLTPAEENEVLSLR